MGKEHTLAADQQALERLGPKVLAGEKRQVPVMIAAVCGAPTGASNVYQISAADWDKLKLSFVGPIGFALWDFEQSSAFVYRYDGSVQCDDTPGETPEAAEAVLTDAGIVVLSARKATDGMMHVAMCGGVTGKINVLEIAAGSVEAALALGFTLAAPRIDATPEASAMGEGLPLPWPFPW